VKVFLSWIINWISWNITSLLHICSGFWIFFFQSCIYELSK